MEDCSDLSGLPPTTVDTERHLERSGASSGPFTNLVTTTSRPEVPCRAKSAAAIVTRDAESRQCAALRETRRERVAAPP